MSKALTLAEPAGYIRIFVDEGEPMVKLLRLAGSRGITPQYVHRLISEFSSSPLMSPATKQPLIEPLSKRELEVLKLLVVGKSNQEIASQLVISLGTVKRHVFNIFGKMNVKSRTECAMRARELHLL
jgi:LuxR family maltose regulon positive regulatory protein